MDRSVGFLECFPHALVSFLKGVYKVRDRSSFNQDGLVFSIGWVHHIGKAPASSRLASTFCSLPELTSYLIANPHILHFYYVVTYVTQVVYCAL